MTVGEVVSGAESGAGATRSVVASGGGVSLNVNVDLARFPPSTGTTGGALLNDNSDQGGTYMADFSFSSPGADL